MIATIKIIHEYFIKMNIFKLKINTVKVLS